MLAFTMLTLVMGISTVLTGAIYPGIAGIVGPTLCCLAAYSLKGSFATGRSERRVAGLKAAITFVVIGVGLVYHSGYQLGVFGYYVPGVAWCLVGLVLGWTNPHSEAIPAAGPQERIVSKADADKRT